MTNFHFHRLSRDLVETVHFHRLSGDLVETVHFHRLSRDLVETVRLDCILSSSGAAAWCLWNHSLDGLLFTVLWVTGQERVS